jgi:hypothetical protein
MPGRVDAARDATDGRFLPTGKTPKHGTKARYTTGCRCTRCTKANATYLKAWRERKASASAL